MLFNHFSNFGDGFITKAPVPGLTGLTLETNAPLPAKAPFTLVVWPADQAKPTAENATFLHVTNNVAGLLTFTRKYNGSNDREILVGDQCRNVVVEQDYEEIKPREKALGNVSGVVQIDCSLADIFTLTMTGDTELEYINADKDHPQEIGVFATQDAVGGRKLTIKSVKWINSTPKFETTKETSVFVSVLVRKATEVYGLGGIETTVSTAGAWKALTLGAKVAQRAARQVHGVRLENNGATARLRGQLEVKAGETVAENESFATVPEGFRPPELVEFVVAYSGGFGVLVVEANGVMKPNQILAAAKSIKLDGITYNIT